MTLTLQEALNSLPTDPDEIAARLVQEGCFGRKGKSRACPLSLYMTRVAGEPVLVSDGCVWLDSHPLHVTTTAFGVRVFVKRFDNGKYPHLEACR